MRSRCCSGPGRPLGDAEAFGRRVTSKARLAHLVGGSGRSEVSPTAILQDTHSLEGEFCELRTDGVLGSSPLAWAVCSPGPYLPVGMDARGRQRTMGPWVT